MASSTGNPLLPIVWLSEDEKGRSLETPEFLRREYGLRAVGRDAMREKASSTHPVLAHAYTYPEEVERLTGFAPSSVRLLIESDETHRPDLARAILATPSIAEVLRNYPYTRATPGQLAAAVGTTLVQAGYSPMAMWTGAIRALTAGGVMTYRKARHVRQLRQRRINTIGLPLGYTDDFVHGLMLVIPKLGWRPLGDAESVIGYLDEHTMQLEELKKDPLGFVGQVGKFQRRAGVHAAGRMGYRIGPVRQRFAAGGMDRDTAAVEYVTALSISRFALCPPGNYSGDSFRLSEATLLRCIPVETTHVTSEPDRGFSVWVGTGAVRGAVWQSALKGMELIDTDQAVSLADAAGHTYRRYVSRARESVRLGIP